MECGIFSRERKEIPTLNGNNVITCSLNPITSFQIPPASYFVYSMVVAKKKTQRS